MDYMLSQAYYTAADSKHGNPVQATGLCDFWVALWTVQNQPKILQKSFVSGGCNSCKSYIFGFVRHIFKELLV